MLVGLSNSAIKITVETFHWKSVKEFQEELKDVLLILTVDRLFSVIHIKLPVIQAIFKEVKN